MSEVELGQGIYPDLSAGTYHADPAAQPSLSATTCKLLCRRFPLHAWHAHPRLNPDYQRVEEKKFDPGTGEAPP